MTESIIIGIISGLLSGVMASVIVWYFTGPFTSVKVVYAEKLALSNTGRVSIKFIVQSKRRALQDVTLKAHIVVAGLNASSPLVETFSSPSLTEGGYHPVIYPVGINTIRKLENQSMESVSAELSKKRCHATFSLLMDSVRQEYSRNVYTQDINNKAQNGTLSLLDLYYCYPQCWVQFFVFGSDSVTSRRLLFESKHYFLNDISYGIYPKGEQNESLEIKSYKKDLLWYVGYGSNMLSYRFIHYIKGGAYAGLGRPHNSCIDNADPIMTKPFLLPYDMYFGSSSKRWNNGGVSFLDSTKTGKSFGVAYLITKTQFNHIWLEENGGKSVSEDSWYNEVLELGTLDGYPAVTITHNCRFAQNTPSCEYLDVLRSGIRENYLTTLDDEIEQYINSCKNSDGN